MSITVKTAPDAAALELDDAKRHLRLELTDTSMDEEVADFIAEATAAVETETSLALIDRTVTLHVDAFRKAIMLPVWPVKSVAEVRYFDGDEEERTLVDTDYGLAKSGKPRRLVFRDDVLSASVSDNPGSIEIDLVIGFGESAGDVPADIRRALKLLISHFDMNREAVSQGVRLKELPLGFDRLVNPHRVHF